MNLSESYPFEASFYGASSSDGKGYVCLREHHLTNDRDLP